MAHPVRLTDKVSSLNDEDELRKRGYILGVTLGEGSYAKVKSAYSEWIDKKVALKIINKRKAPKDFQQKFLPRELEILKKLNHPNVVQLYDIMYFNHKVYIAMEVAGHGDLLEYIKLRGAIQEDKARRFFQQLTNAVEYLHSINIIHRDLKCENILLDTKNNIKVSDFGFARFLNPDDLSKTFCGSAAYAAPEILQGIPYSGFAYDIWSLGVILYIMVCGSMPYDDSNIKKMIKYQTERKVGFSRSKRISDQCKKLIHRLLEAIVAKRASIPEIQRHPWLQVPQQVSSVPGPSTSAQNKSNKENEMRILSDPVQHGGASNMQRGGVNVDGTIPPPSIPQFTKGDSIQPKTEAVAKDSAQVPPAQSSAINKPGTMATEVKTPLESKDIKKETTS